jgi:hypothetical protein
MEFVDKVKTLISSLELKRLLVEIAGKRPDVCMRYRLLGEMWQRNFMRVLKVTDKGVMLNDEVKNKLLSIHDLTSIVQFEIDVKFQEYQPHFHYDVTPEALIT